MPTILARKIAGDVTGIAGLVRCVASRRACAFACRAQRPQGDFGRIFEPCAPTYD
jgi:hypothetical protein